MESYRPGCEERTASKRSLREMIDGTNPEQFSRNLSDIVERNLSDFDSDMRRHRQVSALTLVTAGTTGQSGTFALPTLAAALKTNITDSVRKDDGCLIGLLMVVSADRTRKSGRYILA
jgi:hypothetical protein